MSRQNFTNTAAQARHRSTSGTTDGMGGDSSQEEGTQLVADHEPCPEKQGHLKSIPDPNSWGSTNREKQTISPAITETPMRMT